MSIEEICAKIKKVHEAYVEKVDMVTLGEIYAPDVVVHMPPLPDIFGLETYKQSGIKAHQGFAERRIEWEETLIQGDTVALRFTTHDKYLPMGKNIISRGSVFFHVNNDKIVEEFWNIDILGYFQQLGVIPKQ